MRESTKWTVTYQFANIFLTNLKALGISFVFIAAAFYGFIAKPVFKEVLSLIFMTVYFGIVYSRAHKFASLDKRDYTPTKLSLLKGVLLGVFIAVTFVIMLVIYKLMWAAVGVDGAINSVPAWIYSLIFWFYTIPYNGIMGLAHGEMTLYSQIIMIALPIAATTAGYAAGMMGFNIMDKIAGAVYEKKED